MSFYYPLPEEPVIHEKFEEVDAACTGCGKHGIKRYRTLRASGWAVVERCRECFTYKSIEPARNTYIPLTDGWPTSSAG